MCRHPSYKARNDNMMQLTQPNEQMMQGLLPSKHTGRVAVCVSHRCCAKQLQLLAQAYSKLYKFGMHAYTHTALAMHACACHNSEECLVETWLVRETAHCRTCLNPAPS